MDRMRISKQRLAGAAAVLVLAVCLAVAPGASAQAFAAESVSADNLNRLTASYPLTESFAAEIKSVLSEKKGTGLRIGAVVRLKNTGGQTSRVPDFELRAMTRQGIAYTLEPSAGNAPAVRSQEAVDLSYMAVIERAEAETVSELSWVDVNDEVYPQEETVVLSVPVEDIVWLGNEGAATEATLPWGESFRLPNLAEGLLFTPVRLHEMKTGDRPVAIVTLRTENTGTATETVPAFSIDGQDAKETYSGLMLQPDKEIEPGETTNIHIAIPTEQNTVLGRLIVVNRETFATADTTGMLAAEQYSVGRVSIKLPDPDAERADLAEYRVGEPVAFDPNNDLIDDRLEVSIAELSMSENESDGFHTIVAKLLLTNNSELPLALPGLGMEIEDRNGFSYTGVRQANASSVLLPNLSYVVQYAFALPLTENGEALVLKMTDHETAAPYSVPIAVMKTAVNRYEAKSGTGNGTLSFYPYTVELQNWTLGAFYNFAQVMTAEAAATYSYKLKVTLNIREAENVVVDQHFSRMKIELVDKLDRVIGLEYFSFTGVKHLVNGEQALYFRNIRTEQLESPLTIRIYEAFETPYGEAKRLVWSMTSN